MPDEIKQKESAFLRHRLNKEKELADKVRTDAGIVLTEKDSRGSIHETWTVSAVPHTRHTHTLSLASKHTHVCI